MAVQSLSPHAPQSQPPEIQIEAALKRFRLYLLADRGVRPGTAELYRRMLVKIMRDLGTADPDPDQLREYVAVRRDGRYSQPYLANICRVIEAWTECTGKPLRLGRGRRTKPPAVQALTEGEVAVILAACRTVRERAVLSILAYSGMRNDELCRLRAADVLADSQQIRIRSGKGGVGRTVRVSGRCIQDIHDYLAEWSRHDNDLLFVSEKQGRPFEGATVRRIVRRVVTRTMIRKRVHPHIFRHSLAVNMLARGASLFAIRDQLGHADIATTMIYLRAADSRAAAQYELFCPSYS
jgi:site-specific recombinase XerD